MGSARHLMSFRSKIKPVRYICSRDRRDQIFWFDTDTDTFSGSRSIPRLILILKIGLNRDRYWYWYQENVPGLILIPRLYLIRNCCIWPYNWCRWLDRYRYWYRDPRNAPIETDTDTTALGIGVFDTIPIFPSVSAVQPFSSGGFVSNIPSGLGY